MTIGKQKSNVSARRKILFFLAGLVGLFFLVYLYIVAATLWGRETLQIDNLQRHYRVYVPKSYTGEEPVPLLIVFHMLTGSGRTVEWLTHFNTIAAREGFIVVYPDGYQASWAEGSGLYAADQKHINDVLFTSALIDKLAKEYTIDTNRVYATGFSSGGFMVQRLGCELSDKVTAIATVGATLYKNTLQNCSSQAHLPVLMIHGTADQGVQWDGSLEYLSVGETVQFWVNMNGCTPDPEKRHLPNAQDDDTVVEQDVYGDCPVSTRVILYTILGGGHTWPGGNQAVQLWGVNGKISQDMDASEMIWSFFEGQPQER